MSKTLDKQIKELKETHPGYSKHDLPYVLRKRHGVKTVGALIKLHEQHHKAFKLHRRAKVSIEAFLKRNNYL